MLSRLDERQCENRTVGGKPVACSAVFLNKDTQEMCSPSDEGLATTYSIVNSLSHPAYNRTFDANVEQMLTNAKFQFFMRVIKGIVS